MHYTPYNLVRFYVGEITGTTPQTVKIYTDSDNFIPIQVSDGNKWYSYMLPKDKGLYKIEGDSVKKVVVKSDIVTEAGEIIIPRSTIEASFKGSNTSKITDMSSMFYYCRALTSLDVSSFDTSNVTDMNTMFYGCSSLTSLDVSNFDTSKVTNMNRMFASCSSLTSLDVSSFDTSKITDMSSMFYYCRALTSLDVSSFDNSNVTSMYDMFRSCSGLISLDLSGWDTSNVTSMSNMFFGCTSLKTITMKECTLDTVNKIKDQLASDNITGVTIVT